MKSVSLRNFQLHAKDYLKELPIVLTVYNRPVATVVYMKPVLTQMDKPKEEAEKVLTMTDPIDLPKVNTIETSEKFKPCKHGNVKELCKKCVVSK